MSSSKQSQQNQDDIESEPEMLAAEDALEEIPDDADGDMPMDSDEEDGEEVNLANDSVAYFEHHRDSVFAIAQHPTRPTLVATGGSEGESDDAPGKGYVFDTAGIPQRPLLPENYSGAPPEPPKPLDPLFHIDGHTDSVNALAFTNPTGEYLLSGGLDGRLRAYAVSTAAVGGNADTATQIRFLEEAQEVPEVNWIQACPNGTAHPNVVALGASDGSVWVYQVDGTGEPALQILQSYFLHQASSTAGAWTLDGELLATVAEDGSLFVWDVFGAAGAAGVKLDNGMSIIALDSSDARFQVEGGLYSVACSPTGAFLAVGGAGGAIKVVSLPRLSGAGGSAGGASRAGGRRGGGGGAAAGGSDQQVGQILASLHAQGDGVETLSFSQLGPAGTLLAAGSVDGSIAVYDAQRSFQVRRLIGGAHGDFSVVKVEFVRGSPHLLTSCGMDGVVRRWDVRGTTAPGGQRPLQQAGQGVGAAAAAAGLIKEWRGHRGDGEGGGVLGFVQGDTGERIVTAGDDGVVLVFEA